jgi:nitrogen fixation NifU-like protein
MNVLNELYREAVLEHNKNPRNVGVMKHASHSAKGSNPLCGDDVEVFFEVKNGLIDSVSWTGKGCAVSMASTSILSGIIKGKTQEETLRCIENFLTAMKSTDDSSSSDLIEEAKVLEGVKEFPVRVKCAVLGWKTAQAALLSQQETVTTEIE